MVLSVGLYRDAESTEAVPNQRVGEQLMRNVPRSLPGLFVRSFRFLTVESRKLEHDFFLIPKQKKNNKDTSPYICIDNLHRYSIFC